MSKPVILVFGSSGVGKSSLINSLFDQDLSISDSAKGCTFTSKIIETENYKIIDTVGLGEVQSSQTRNMESIRQLLSLLKTTKEGFSLLIFVKKCERLTEVDRNNYELFCGSICERKIPIICCCTNADNTDGEIEDWWINNRDTFFQSGMQFQNGISGCYSSNKRLFEINKPLMDKTKIMTLKIINETKASRNYSLVQDNTSMKYLFVRIWNSFCSFSGIKWFIVFSDKIKDLCRKLGLSEEESVQLTVEYDGL